MKAGIYVDYENVKGSDKIYRSCEIVKAVREVVMRYAQICFISVYTAMGYPGISKPMNQAENYELW